MCDVVHRGCSASDHVDYGGIGVDAQVLGDLVVGALDECAVYCPYGVQAAFCHT